MKARNYSKVALLIESVNELLQAEHFEASKLIAKKLQAESDAYAQTLIEIPNEPPVGSTSDSAPVEAPPAPAQ